MLGAVERDPSEAEAYIGAEKWDQVEAVRAAANRELHADLLGPAVEKLSRIALSAVVVFAVLLGAFFVLLPGGATALGGAFSALAKLLVTAALSSLALYGVTRIPGIRPQVVHDAGYLYLILISLVLGLLRHFQPWQDVDIVRQVSPVAILILVFAALIPAAPRKALAVYLGAAAMDPLGLYFMQSAGGLPEGRQVALLLWSPFLAAIVAHRISIGVHRLSEGIVRAREVGSYKLVERLGVGGMAEVWRADHRLLARPAAVKLIRPEVLIEHGPRDAERLLRLFAREARATASLSSPHTIQVYDFGITREGAFYYVMELLDGLDLRTLVERFGPQPVERVAALLGQACHSLAEAHDRNFVHRDVKPANIFACRYGGDYDFVKVLDFGLVLDRHPTAEELEDERRFAGTPAVMAPEMVRFQAPVDARADIYALGCVAYWLLTGKRVFEASTRHDLMLMHAHQKPLPPSRRVETPLHSGLEAIVMSCLEKNPNKRPQSVRELKDGLAALEFEHAWTDERARLWWKKHGGASPSQPPPAEAEASSTPAARSEQAVDRTPAL
jgi:serine/threonine protein kinase